MKYVRLTTAHTRRRAPARTAVATTGSYAICKNCCRFIKRRQKDQKNKMPVKTQGFYFFYKLTFCAGFCTLSFMRFLTKLLRFIFIPEGERARSAYLLLLIFVVAAFAFAL